MGGPAMLMSRWGYGTTSILAQLPKQGLQLPFHMVPCFGLVEPLQPSPPEA